MTSSTATGADVETAARGDPVDRAGIARDLTALNAEHAELAAALKREVATALDRADRATSELIHARQELHNESNRVDALRRPLERALRDSVPPSLGEFIGWCIAEQTRLRSAINDPQGERRSRVLAAGAAIREQQALELLPDDELVRRIAELRDEIDPDYKPEEPPDGWTTTAPASIDEVPA